VAEQEFPTFHHETECHLNSDTKLNRKKIEVIILQGNPTHIDWNEVLTWCVGAVADYTIKAGQICHQRLSQFHRVDYISIPNHSRSRNTKECETTIMRIACGLNVKTMRLAMTREEGSHIPNLVF
jgi:hypothetical protein